jgi:putative transposase
LSCPNSRPGWVSNGPNFYLYVILDIFSRYVVGWMVANRESAELAKRLLAETCQKHQIAPDQLTLHADRGASMRSKPVALRLADLGVTKIHSRPHDSDDNPFSESHFKTLKIGPSFLTASVRSRRQAPSAKLSFPGTTPNTTTAASARSRPEVLHYGRADEIIGQRQTVLSQAYERNSARFFRALPKPPAKPTAVWINPPVRAASEQEQH